MAAPENVSLIGCSVPLGTFHSPGAGIHHYSFRVCLASPSGHIQLCTVSSLIRNWNYSVIYKAQLHQIHQRGFLIISYLWQESVTLRKITRHNQTAYNGVLVLKAKSKNSPKPSSLPYVQSVAFFSTFSSYNLLPVTVSCLLIIQLLYSDSKLTLSVFISKTTIYLMLHIFKCYTVIVLALQFHPTMSQVACMDLISSRDYGYPCLLSSFAVTLPITSSTKLE